VSSADIVIAAIGSWRKRGGLDQKELIMPFWRKNILSLLQY
jgi:hypothetical protein